MSAGYQRLLTFEHRGGGFSWFGERDGMPYLSVTAFGLMEFADMAKVHPVDEAMIQRTRRWLLSQQAADGSWKGDRGEYFSFHTSLVRNTAFVIWALASSGHQGPELTRGLSFIKDRLGQEKPDPYTLAFVANAFLTAARTDPFGLQVIAQLAAAARQVDDKASWDTGGTQTSFHGAGRDGAVTTTALVAHALLLAGTEKGLLDRALAFLTSSRDARGNFGSTQATIWTLRTLLAAARAGDGGATETLVVSMDGREHATLTLTPDQADVMTTIDLAQAATPGDHAVALRFVGTGRLSYNVVAEHHVPWAAMPAPGPAPLAVSITYDRTRLAVDDRATASVVVRNTTASTQDMVMVTVGVPPGFQIEAADLDRYRTQRKLSAWELTGKQLILYLTTLPAGRSETFQYRLRALMPVRAQDGGAEAYLSYQPEQRAAARATVIEAVAAM